MHNIVTEMFFLQISTPWKTNWGGGGGVGGYIPSPPPHREVEKQLASSQRHDGTVVNYQNDSFRRS